MTFRASAGRRRQALAVATMSAALALTLSACSPSGGGSNSAGTAPTTIGIGIGAQPATFDPAQLDLGESAVIWTGVFDTLLKVDNDGVVQPNAAKSYEYSADGRVLTLSLREGMTFSNGDAVTSADVVATINRMKETPGVRTPDVASIASVDAPDDLTVVLNLNAPDPSLLINLATGAGVIADAATLNNDDIALNPIGSGPYVLDTAATVTGSSYVMTKREDHWNAAAYPFQTVTARVLADSQARFNALQAGEISVSTIASDQADSIKAAGFSVHVVDASAVGSLLFLDRTGSIVPALGDVRVRQAINMAFDRQLYVDQLLLGAGVPTEQFYNPGQPGYVEDLNKTYPYDVKGAKALLAEAGYPDGFALTMPSTYFSQATEPALTQTLADIGITVTWESVPPQEVVSSLSSGKYAMAWFYEGLNSPSIMTRSDLGADGLLNPTSYTTPELTALLDKVNSLTADPDAQGAAYEEINKYSVENALVAPVYYTSTYYGLAKGISFLADTAVPLDIANYGIAG
ncbi:hypothetical protein TZ00_06985 [Agreia bicolorata]|uniref:Solute-binding protein family 5 domain-containing protein n=1 Tax=Agreia bicolorata TaxID=110935 RepID=A0ABR5CGA0_9MICO|nr:hypothetical protein TZ00_06985 [Agreia bicolorata]